MTPRDLLHGITRLVVDGSNQREPGSGPVAEASVTAGLRAAFPLGIEIHVVFDTDPPVGAASVRVVGGLTIHHARATGGDDTVVRLAAVRPAGTLVVSDDIELRQRVGELGARAERNEWLREQRGLRRAPTASVAGRLAPRPTSDEAGRDEGDERTRGPGRRATLKRGNPHRQKKRR